jgi:hypothetical protein
MRLDQTFIDGLVARVGDAFGNRLPALQSDGRFKQLIRAAITPVPAAPRGKVIPPQHGSQTRAVGRVGHKPKLRRFALLAFGHSYHNQHTDQPVGNLRPGSGARPATLAFGFRQQRNRQRLQTRARLGTFTHPWVLACGLVFSWQKKT